MNLPNKLTILRVIMIPFFLVALLVEGIPAGKWIALAIFIIASFTDMLDGKIARKYNLITNFGKFMDPLADKLLVSAALIALIPLGKIPAWVVIVIISREFIISGFRLIASDNGVVIAASYWGKFKTVFQMIMIIWLILDLNWFIVEYIFDFPIYDILGNILIVISLVLTVISMIDYIAKNKAVLKENNK